MKLAGLNSAARSARSATSGRGRCSLLHVPALAETWRARDARLTLPLGVHRTRVSEMRRHGASTSLAPTRGRSWALGHIKERSGGIWESRSAG